MEDVARHLLKSVEALSGTEKPEVLAKLLRRADKTPYAFPTDDEVLQAADRVFGKLDRCEARR